MDSHHTANLPKPKVLALCGRDSSELLLKSLVHVFLPKKTPNKEQMELDDIENVLLYCITDYVTEALDNLNSNFKGSLSLMRNWMKLQEQIKLSEDDPTSFPYTFQDIINKLCNQEKVALYIRKQNCTIIFTRSCKSSFRIDTFRSILPTNSVMSTVGSLSLLFPHTVDTVQNVDLLNSVDFANQLYHLTVDENEISLRKTRKGGRDFAETRDAAEPYLVSDLLVGMLAPDPNSVLKSPQVRKKIRDAVTWNSAYLPFRRSGLWFAAKAALHLSLIEDTNNEEIAKLLYKGILLKFQADLGAFHFYIKPNDWDFTHQILAKLGKRAKKLNDFTIFTNNAALLTFKDSILDGVYSTIHKIHSHMMVRWTEVSGKIDGEINRITRTTEEFQMDLDHYIPRLNSYLKSNREPINHAVCDGTEGIISLFRKKSIKGLMGGPPAQCHITDANLTSESIWLHDVEVYAKDQDSGIFEPNLSPIDIYRLIMNYAESVTKIIQSTPDPLQFSRMVMTLFGYLKRMDVIATKKYPLLREYQTGVDTSIFKQILAPDASQMYFLDDLETYFERRNDAAKYPSIIQSCAITDSSFSVRYAMSNSGMVILREKILQDTELKIQIKYEEVERAKEMCQQFEASLAGLECRFQYDNYRMKPLHVNPCKKCQINSFLGQKRRSITRYEKPLPEANCHQFAIMFELLIPLDIFCLRQALSLITKEVLKCPVYLEEKKIHTKWMIYDGLGQYIQNLVDLPYPQKLVSLGSTKKPVSVTHYDRKEKKKQTPNVQITAMKDFILENGMDCVLHYDMEPKLEHYKKPCDPFNFQISSTADAAKYQHLQSYLSGTSHSQNQVISKQHTLCHRSLSTAEFTSFGSLRSGHRIQLRNLYKFLADRSLNIEKEPVLALILQAIWNPGSFETEANNVVRRSCHSDFYNDRFSDQFLELLKNIVETHAQNWNAPLVLCTVVCITVKILETNENHEIKLHSSNLLRQCRQVADNWMNTISTLLSESKNMTKEDEGLLKLRILESALCSMLTYPSSSKSSLLKTVVVKSSDALHWFKTSTLVYYYVNVEKIHEKMSPFMKSLLQTTRTLTSLAIQDRLHSLIKETGSVCMNDYVSGKGNWYPESKLLSQTWKQCNNSKSHAYEGKFSYQNRRTHVIHVDTLFGTYLVDGYPPSYLPAEITCHDLFQSFFTSANFKVQRDNSTFTSEKVNGMQYKFFIKKDGYSPTNRPSLICREHHETHFLELINPDNFRNKSVPVVHSSQKSNSLDDVEISTDIMSPVLLENYTHWLDSSNNSIHFRRRQLLSERKPSTDPDYILSMKLGNPTCWLLKDYITQKKLLSVQSKGFKTINEILARLEDTKYVFIYMDMENQAISASLPRHPLCFELQNGLLYSMEYPEHYISLSQSKRTLVGLQNGLLLENPTIAEISGKRKLILVPHGKIKISPDYLFYNVHHETTIEKVNLRQPSFFVYEVDEILQRLKADKSKSAWLYLAALHGATSSCLPDPFTDLTGTEMAIWLLQSAQLWSCSPYDQESKTTLEQIRSFSPQREYYPPHLESMEKITWSCLPSYNAHDGYEIIVKKLLNDSERLAALYTNQEHSVLSSTSGKTTEKLQIRANFRHNGMYNPAAHLKKSYLHEAEDRCENKTPKQFSITTRKLETECILREFAQVCISKRCPRLNLDLQKLLIVDEPLPGSTDDSKICEGNMMEWTGLDVRTDWIRLYSLSYSASEKSSEHLLYMVLCTLAHLGAPKDQLLALYYISKFPLMFPSPEILNDNRDYNPKKHTFQRQTIESILDSERMSFSNMDVYTTILEYESAKQDYETNQRTEIIQLSNSLENLWKKECAHRSFTRISITCLFAGISTIKSKPCEEVLLKYLTEWQRNYKLKMAVQRIENILGTLGVPTQMQEKIISMCKLKFEMRRNNDITLELDLVTDLRLVMSNIEHELAQNTHYIYFSGRLPFEFGEDLLKTRNAASALAVKLRNKLQVCLVNSTKIATCLENTGLLPRLVPLVLFGRLLDPELVPSEILTHIGAIAVVFSHLKQLNKCLKYSNKGEFMAIELKQEKENKGHENWHPNAHPEWLLLELDLDVMIRPIQVKVAQQMMKMPDGKNGVMQLNMGEGKTSVIVPMLVCTMATTDTLTRVTVLNSIFKTNLDILTFAIGGLLNRRVYHFPCRRGTDIDNHLPGIWEVYKECLEMKGVVLTLPEYRLSQPSHDL